MDAFKNASNLVVPSLCEFIVFATEFTAGLIIAILMPPLQIHSRYHTWYPILVTRLYLGANLMLQKEEKTSITKTMSPEGSERKTFRNRLSQYLTTRKEAINNLHGIRDNKNLTLVWAGHLRIVVHTKGRPLGPQSDIAIRKGFLGIRISCLSSFNSSIWLALSFYSSINYLKN